MQKLISILLLTCLCTTLLGYHLVFHFQLIAIKDEMKTSLQNEKNHKDIVEISFSSEGLKQLDWEDDHEFCFNGEMYDVIEKKVKENKIIMRCIPDKKETALLHEYQKNSKHSSSHSAMAQLITAQFILLADFSLKQPEKTIKKNFKDYLSSLQNLPSSILPQPPDVC